ncbi:hypothetical protein F4810DRAFT_212602 [Camillea tinctor]|nr:hypothetical protein F4810DRAFT_212602 [Camillea tinctor]
MHDILEYTGRQGFQSRRLYAQAKKTIYALAERRLEYQHLCIKCVEGSKGGQQTWEVRRTDYLQRLNLTEEGFTKRVLRRYGGDPAVVEEEEAPEGPDPSLLVEQEPAEDGGEPGLELDIELTAEDWAIIEQFGMSKEEYIQNLIDMAEEMAPLEEQFKINLKISEDGEKEEQDSSASAADDVEDSHTSAPEPEPVPEEDAKDEELYDSDGFLREEKEVKKKRQHLDLFEWPALDAASAAWWQKEAVYACRRLVRAIDEELDEPVRVAGVRTWLGLNKTRVEKYNEKKKQKDEARAQYNLLGKTF